MTTHIKDMRKGSCSEPFEEGGMEPFSGRVYNRYAIRRDLLAQPDLF
jgi:hypothetical protein